MVHDLRVIGKLVTLMGLEYFHFQTAVNMKAAGTKVNIMVKEFTQPPLVPNMTETGNLENITVSEHFFGQTEVSTKESGATVEKTGEESSPVSTEHNMKASGKTGNITVRANSLHQMARCMLVSLRMESILPD